MSAAKIAAKLTKAQREMLVWSAAGHVLLRRSWARYRLARKGLIEPFLPEHFHKAAWCPSPLGLAVRAELERGK